MSVLHESAFDRLVELASGPLKIWAWTWFEDREMLKLRMMSGAQVMVSMETFWRPLTDFSSEDRAIIPAVYCILRREVALAELAYEFETLEVRD